MSSLLGISKLPPALLSSPNSPQFLTPPKSPTIKRLKPFPISNPIPIKKAEEIFSKRKRSTPRTLASMPDREYPSLTPEELINEMLLKQETLRKTRAVLNAKLSSPPSSEDVSPVMSPLLVRDGICLTESVPQTPMNTPPTPCHRVRRNSLNEFSQKILQLAVQREFEFLTEKGMVKFKIKRTCVGRGDYCEVFEIAEGQPQLFSSFKNNQILFKRYQKRLVECRGNSVSDFFNYSMDQYDQLEELGYPIAQILNRRTAKEDGFFLVEKIPHAFPKPLHYGSCDEIELYLNQVACMFQVASDFNIPVDLKRQNVKIKDDGTVTLIDFREEHNPLSILLENLIESFAEDSEEIAEKLRPKKPGEAVPSIQALSFFTNQ